MCLEEFTPLVLIYTQGLRLWTVFRAEMAHSKTQHVAYRKGLERDIKEVKEACQLCLDTAKYVYSAFAAILCFPASVWFIIDLGIHTNHGLRG